MGSYELTLETGEETSNQTAGMIIQPEVTFLDKNSISLSSSGVTSAPKRSENDGNLQNPRSEKMEDLD